ncbi:hypothetical protein WBK31_08740 [Nonomuraea sp. N2-4H]|uniref:hypothetical protein n=1 Tax=unclassified Nonomuraea TaxID=2593643 RepID=UPI00324E2201
MSALLASPLVDLDTGAVIAHPAVVDPSGVLRATPLPMVLELPIRVVLSGAGALAPLHEALRRAGRHPREAILLLTGTCGEQDRPLLKVGIDGLRTIGYLLGFADVGIASPGLDLMAGAAPTARYGCRCRWPTSRRNRPCSAPACRSCCCPP